MDEPRAGGGRAQGEPAAGRAVPEDVGGWDQTASWLKPLPWSLTEPTGPAVDFQWRGVRGWTLPCQMWAVHPWVGGWERAIMPQGPPGLNLPSPFHLQ